MKRIFRQFSGKFYVYLKINFINIYDTSIKKCYAQLFCTYLSFVFFLAKTNWLKKLPIKCWWNWLQDIGTVIGTVNDSTIFPLGIQTWYMKKKCDELISTPVPTVLKLTKVCNEYYSKQKIRFKIRTTLKHLKYRS